MERAAIPFSEWIHRCAGSLRQLPQNLQAHHDRRPCLPTGHSGERLSALRDRAEEWRLASRHRKGRSNATRVCVVSTYLRRLERPSAQRALTLRPVRTDPAADRQRPRSPRHRPSARLAPTLDSGSPILRPGCATLGPGTHSLEAGRTSTAGCFAPSVRPAGNMSGVCGTEAESGLQQPWAQQGPWEGPLEPSLGLARTRNEDSCRNPESGAR